MRFTLAHAALAAALGLIATSPAIAQTRVDSIADLRHELAAGDIVTVVAGDGHPIVGRLMRVGDADLELQPARGAQRTPGTITMALDNLRSLERPRDPVRNGIVRGAVIGAGVGGAAFAYALAIDRNEIDEWAGFYLGAAALTTGMGALIGWAIDGAKSKPHIRFDAPDKARSRVSVRLIRSRGLGVTVSFAR